jgi:hypothetical protein
VDVVAGLVNVLDEPADGLVVDVDQLDGVAAQNRQAAQVLGEPDRSGQFGADGRTEGIGVLAEPVADLAEDGRQSRQGLAAPPRQADPAEQQIENGADPRLEEDQQQPALGGDRRAAEGHDNQHHQAEQPSAGQDDPAPDRRVKRIHVPPSRAENRPRAAPNGP